MWFTSSISSGPTYISVLDLKTYQVTRPNLVQPRSSEKFVLSNPNGGFYYDGYVYITMLGDATHMAGLVKINPRTLETTTVLNSYFGLGLPSVTDVSIMRDKHTDQIHIFFQHP
jgi:gluconolactonase